MYISVHPVAKFGKLIVNHWTDVAHTILVDTQVYYVITNSNFSIIIPAISSAMEIIYENDGLVSDNVQVIAEQTNIATGRPVFPNTAVNINAASTNVGANSTVFYGPPFICPGPAWFHAASGAAAGLLTVSVIVSLDGLTSDHVIFSGDPSVNLNQLIDIGNQPVMVKCQNTDVAAHTHTFSLTPDGRW